MSGGRGLVGAEPEPNELGTSHVYARVRPTISPAICFSFPERGFGRVREDWGCVLQEVELFLLKWRSEPPECQRSSS